MKKIIVVEPDQSLSWVICERLKDDGYEPVPCAPYVVKAAGAA